MQLPPHFLPEGFDPGGIGAFQDAAETLVDQGVNGDAAGARGVGVADAFGAVGVAEADGHELEMRHESVGGIGQRHREFDAVEAGFDGGDGHGASPLMGEFAADARG